MPTLKRPDGAPSVELPPRQAVLAGETDVLVVGGGPAGLGAALGAAQAGARVILAERYGFLGGNATAALVMPLMSFHTQMPTRERRGATTLLADRSRPGRSRGRRRAGEAPRASGQRRRRDPADARHRATWCRSIRSGSSSWRSTSSTRRACSFCSTPLRAESSARARSKAWCSRRSPGRSRSARR